jgi:integrase
MQSRGANYGSVRRKRPAGSAYEVPDALLSAAIEFGEARGWDSRIVRDVLTGIIALVAAHGPGPIQADAVRDLKADGISPLRILEFLTDYGLIEGPAWDPQAKSTARRLEPLGPVMRSEVQGWINVLKGHTGRRGRPRSPMTIKGYLRVLGPACSAWSASYESLRQVTTADIVEQLDKHQGTGRRMATTAMRSLFRILKEERMIFGNPAARITSGPYVPPPILPVEPPTRAGLLARDASPLFGLVVLLAGVHALRTKEIAGLMLDAVDLQRGTLVAKGQERRLDKLTLGYLRAWMAWRGERWPLTANPYLLVNQAIAGGTRPVNTAYLQQVVQGSSVTVEALRRDRLLAEAVAAGGDPLTLAHLFGLSHGTAIQYCSQAGLLGEPDEA